MKDTALTKKLISWYEIHKRELPWRDTSDPYKIWVSEIILQQTRIDQGRNYFLRFVKFFPDVFSLANASRDKVMKLWQGLGYYSRANNMHETAKRLVKEYKGEFPETATGLMELKGIGPYTAAAVASIAFNKPSAVVDGNVVRLLSRMFGIEKAYDKPEGKQAIHKKANELIDQNAPGTYNQAIMDFGALVCIPKNPHCHKCPLKEKCFAFQRAKVDSLPVASKPVRKKNRYLNYLLMILKTSKDDYTFMKLRTEKDIWKNLHDFPLLETKRPASFKALVQNGLAADILGKNSYEYIESHGPMKHQLTHRTLYASFHVLHIRQTNQYLDTHFKKVKISAIDQLALPRLIDRFVENFFELQ